MWPFKTKQCKCEEKLKDAQILISMLNSFLFVASTDRPVRPGSPVEFAMREVQQYKQKGDTAEIVQEIANNAAQAPAMLAALNAMAAEMGRLREALEWYANEENWTLRIGNDENGHARVLPNAYFTDKGKKACKALKEPVK